MTDTSGIIISITGSSNDTNVILSSNSSSILDNGLSYLSYAELVDMDTSLKSKIDGLETKSKSLEQQDLTLSRGLNSIFQSYLREVDISLGVKTSAYTYPPEFNNYSGNEHNFSLKEVTSSGVGSEIDGTVYLKLNNYATGNVTKNLVNVEGIDTFANPLIYGYNELFAEDPSNIVNFSGNSGFNTPDLNAVGSQSNCNGQSFANGYLLVPWGALDASSQPILPIYASFLNVEGNSPPPSGAIYWNPPDTTLVSDAFPFVKIDELGVDYATRLFHNWAGLSNEDTSEAFFSKLTHPLSVLRAKYVAYNTKVYKLERLQQYNIAKLPSKLVGELLTRAEGDLSNVLLDNPISVKGFPTIADNVQLMKDLVTQGLAINTLLDASNTINNLSQNVYSGVAANGLWNFGITTPEKLFKDKNLITNPIGGAMNLYWFHICCMLLMCNDSNLTDAQINAFKNISVPMWDTSGSVHDIPFSLDFKHNTQLPASLANVPVMQNLWWHLNNTFTLNNDGHFGGSNVPLSHTLLGDAIVNAYDVIYGNLAANTDNSSNALLTPEEVYKHLKFVSYLSGFVDVGGTFRFKNPNAGGAYAAGTLNDASMKVLSNLFVQINTKLIKEFVTRNEVNKDYHFDMIFPRLAPLSGGSLEDYQAALVAGEIAELADEDCPC